MTDGEPSEKQTKLEEYFSSYEDLDIHKLMLTDRPRQAAYREAILSNSSLFAGKTVLDVGAGTGILSCFCAQAGAAKVYAIEASKIANLARDVVKENGFDRIIEVHQTKVEDFKLNGDDQQQIDIIVSEWMGFYLLHEGMLDSVLFARDRFLKPSGSMFPQNASIYVAPCALPSLFDAWNSHDGVQMTAFGAALRAQKTFKPEIMVVPAKDLLHEGTVMAWFDLNEVSLENLNEFVFNEVVVAQKPGQYQGICLWFDVSFPTNDEGDTVTLSTAPTAESTHWKQTVILLPDQHQENIEQHEPVAFNLAMRRNDENQRQCKLELTILDPSDVEHPFPCDCNFTKCILVKEHLKLSEAQDIVPELI
ncbi:protein arginine N-methyltransferase 6 [Contarinia nasturtii]|uniref:protein arginine N-methyltransferase 6 n=1 Tax=Contarinia nasturtii TaxID=265458 RepID=UPI0012D3CE3F|nr:protein arginine N-methyltransferase 6 [Contarinia nasturtii]